MDNAKESDAYGGKNPLALKHQDNVSHIDKTRRHL